MDRPSGMRRTMTRGSLFGGPDNSAVRILRRNETMVGKIKGAIYWYYFRAIFPYIAPISAVVMYIIPLTTYNSLGGFLFCGSLLSMVMCLLSILSYIQIVPWRKHPSPLIFYRTCVHLVFSISIMVNALSSREEYSSSCIALSFLTQFTFFTGECWLLTIAVDLILSLSNPFTSFKSNVTKYHAVVWLSGTVNAILLASSNSCQGLFANHICWIDADSPLSGCIWGFYISWVLVFYVFCIGSLFFATLRISRGLESSYTTRRACVQETFSVVVSYILYSVVVCLLYIIIVGQAGKDSNPDYNSGFLKHMRNLIAYLLALRGYVDACLWFRMRDFKGISKFKPAVTSSWLEWTSPLIGRPVRENDASTNRGSTSGRQSVFSDGRMTRTQNDIETAGSGPRMSVEDDFGVDIDLSPQLNLALREEVVHFTTKGIIRAAELAVRPSPDSTRCFDIDEKHLFTDYHSNVFQRLRESDGVGEDWYISQISQPTKERLTEGGSGAFMFFCGSGEFVVKTVKSEEADTLLDILDQYRKHLEENPSSMLVRFYGLHSLTMYNQVFRFVVMKNIFPPAATINQRYDIKGSWVSRSGGVVPPGKKIFCRNCGELFISGSQTPCPEIVGVHEPNFVLKDNDFTSKIRLRPEDAYSTIDILNRDSDALCSMGITDYSLLIGVRNLQYEVDPERVITRRRKSTVCPDSIDSAMWSIGNRSMLGASSTATGTGNTTAAPTFTSDGDITPIKTGLAPIPDVSVDRSSCEELELAAELRRTAPLKQQMSTSRESFESEMTQSMGPGIRRPPLTLSNSPRPTDSSAPRESSQTTVNVQQPAPGDANSSNSSHAYTPSPAVIQSEATPRDSNMLEITEEEISGGYLARSVIAPGVYYLGIIDILQKWTWEKRLERFIKVHILRKSPHGISCMDPEPYRNRFQYKISQIIEHSIFIREITGSWKGKRELTEPTPLIDTA